MSSAWECNQSLSLAALLQRYSTPHFCSLPALPLLPSSTLFPTPPIIPSIRSRRMSFFSRKKNVSYILSSTVSTIASLPFFFFFISTRRSTTHSPPHSPHTSLATPTCKPLALFVYPYPHLTPHSTILCNSQPSHPELTGLLQPIINFSSPSSKLPTLQLVPLLFRQWPRFTIYSTAATATSTDPRPITITSPCATTTAPACLSMDRASSEPSTPDLSQQECSPIRAVAIAISPIWSCTSRVCHSRRRIVPFRRSCTRLCTQRSICFLNPGSICNSPAN